MVMDYSQITIYGETNVNQFQCRLEETDSRTSLQVSSRWSDFVLSFRGLKIAYPVDGFNCGIEAMNADLRKLMKSDAHPQIYLQIDSIMIPRSNREIAHLQVMAGVTITLAGVTRSYLIENGEVLNQAGDTMIFRGSKSLKMSDFGITPPTKFFDVIRVSDWLKVAFELKMDVATTGKATY